jgi:hypothetical protein
MMFLQGALSIVVTDNLSGNVVATKNIAVSCDIGQAPFPQCSDSSSGSPGAATNNGDWTTVDIPVAPGAPPTCLRRLACATVHSSAKTCTVH